MPRYLKTLPPKYYLAHFQECLAFLLKTSEHLFDTETSDFVSLFFTLPEDAQCLLVRSANRNSPCIKRSSLDYAEIAQTDANIARLVEAGLLSPIGIEDTNLWLNTLTKPELLTLLDNGGIAVKRSARKADIVAIAVASLSLDALKASPGSRALWQSYLVRRFDRPLRYLLFLYFGSMNYQLNAFSMRDLGVLRTRAEYISHNARFSDREAAQCAFKYAALLHQLKQQPEAADTALAQALIAAPSLSGIEGRRRYDQVCLRWVKANPDETELALALLAKTESPEGQEKWCRQAYKQGLKNEVKDRLLAIMEEPESESLLQFAEDFYARKYEGKKTSIYTDMLRKSQRRIRVDEIFLGAVERGVQNLYKRQGCECIRSENRLWQCLFGLTFWDTLFENAETGLAGEFDRIPQALKDNTFYQCSEELIERRLAQMHSTQDALKLLTCASVKYYGKTNGIFRWRSNQLEWLTKFLQHVPIDIVVAHLREMARDYRNMTDGYPDIMVIENNSLRFEEIKAPGDQLRKNQLRMIRHLRKLGFKVDITTAEWCIDPEQTYAVVDIETTGGRAGNHRITEIGIVKLKGDTRIGQWQTLLNPQRHIPANITRLTGIDNALVKDAPIFAEIADELAAELEGCVFVAHNVNFDYQFIRQEFERMERRFRLPKLCTVQQMRKAVPGLKSYSLANLTAHFGIDMQRHHRALSDAHAAAELLRIINQHRRASASNAQ